MKERIMRLLTVSVIMGWTGIVTATPIANFVTIDGKDWAQPTDFLGISWDAVDAVCPETSDGVCGEGQINEFDMFGWTWANPIDVGNLFVALGIPEGLLTEIVVTELDSVWAPSVRDVFDSAPDSTIEAVWGFSRMTHPIADQIAIAPRLFDALPGSLDSATITNPDLKDSFIPARGAWFNRTTSVPEPSTIVILTLGLLGLGFSRRRLHTS